MVSVRHCNIEVTSTCNQRCLYCFNDSGPRKQESRLSVTNWEEFLEFQAGIGLQSAHFTGGEPFAFGGTMRLIGTAQSLGLGTSVLSNGYRIPEFVEKFPAEFQRLSVAQISLDAAEAKIHDERRGMVGAWRQAIAAIRALRRKNIECEISCTVSKENLAQVPRIADFCRRQAIRLVVRPLVAFGRGTCSALGSVDEDELNVELEKIQNLGGRVLTNDRFCYVPDRLTFDSDVRKNGIVTVMPDGRFRSGLVFFPQLRRSYSSVTGMLASPA